MIVTLLTDYGRDDDFVGRLPRRDPRDRARRRRSSTSRTACRATACARARWCCATRCPTCRSACTWRSSTRRSAPSAARSRCARADGRLLVGPDNGLLSLAWERCGGRRGGGRHQPLAAPARAGVGHLPRPRHLRAGRRAPGRAAPSWPTPATRSTPPSSQTRRAARAARGGRRAGRARAGDRPLRQRRAQRRPRGPGRHRAHARRHGRDRGRRASATSPPTRRRSPTSGRASCSSTRTPTARSRWRSTAATPPRRSACGPDAEVRLRPR